MRLILLFLILATVDTYPQCCSVGIPTGGTTNVGIVPRNQLRANLFTRFSQSNDYFEGSNNIGKGLVRNGKFSFIGISLGYGLTGRISAELEGGYFLNKSQEYSIGILDASGVSNQFLSLKYNIFDNLSDRFELTLGGGVKIPLQTEPLAEDGVQLPYDLQPSTGAFGFVGSLFFSIDLFDDSKLLIFNRNELNFSNNLDYKYGDLFITSLFLTKPLFENISGILQIRNEIKSQDELDGASMVNTGGLLIILSPQLSYNLDNYSFSILFDYPFYKYYNGRQLGNNYSIALNITAFFDFN